MENTILHELHFAGELLDEAIQTIEKRRSTHIYECQLKNDELDKNEKVIEWDNQLSQMKKHLESIQQGILDRIEFLAVGRFEK